MRGMSLGACGLLLLLLPSTFVISLPSGLVLLYRTGTFPRGAGPRAWTPRRATVVRCGSQRSAAHTHARVAASAEVPLHMFHHQYSWELGTRAHSVFAPSAHAHLTFFLPALFLQVIISRREIYYYDAAKTWKQVGGSLGGCSGGRARSSPWGPASVQGSPWALGGGSAGRGLHPGGVRFGASAWGSCCGAEARLGQQAAWQPLEAIPATLG